MKIALLTLGTRGDVQPFIALGKALKARGHDVLVGAPDNFQSWIEGHGLAYRSIGVDMHAFVQSPEGREVMGGSVFAMARMWSKTIVPLTRRSLDAMWRNGRDADVIVCHPKTAGAADVAEATGASVVHVSPFPIFPSTAFPLFVFPGSYGAWLNRLSYKLLLFSRLIFLPTVNRWREEVLGLRRLSPFRAVSGAKTDPAGQLCAVSPTVVPGYPASDSENIQTTGWGGMAEINVPETIHVIKDAPHSALFKRVSAVVHHGGAGTTAAGLRAGLPTLICPLTVDQPFWGGRIFSLGCGPRPQPLKRLKPQRFADGLIELIGTESYRNRAEEVARAIAEEDGVARAVEIIESVSQ